MDEDELMEFLRNNLAIQIEREHDYCSTAIVARLLLKGEKISESHYTETTSEDF
jgi:hypothetical protein